MATIIEQSGKLTTAIKRAITALDKLDDTWHNLCCSALYHYKEHGDLQFATMIAKGTSRYSTVKEDEGHTKPRWDGRSIRGAAIRKWFEDFAGVKWSVVANKNEGGYRASKSLDAIKRGDIDLAKAEATPFWSYTSENTAPPKVWDAAAQATRLRDQAMKLLQEGESKSGKQILPEEAMEARAVASALVNSLSEFLKMHGDHANPDNKPATIEQEVASASSEHETLASAANA